MIYIWTSYVEINTDDWDDFKAYRAQSKVAWRSEKRARCAARSHEYRTGYETKVVEMDGRKWKGEIRD